MNTVKLALKLCQFMVVGGKKRFGTDKLWITDVFDNGPCNTQAIECTCTAADFVKNDKTVFCSVCLLYTSGWGMKQAGKQAVYKPFLYI